jgi:hypothetical protein
MQPHEVSDLRQRCELKRTVTIDSDVVLSLLGQVESLQSDLETSQRESAEYETMADEHCADLRDLRMAVMAYLHDSDEDQDSPLRRKLREAL